ncbi:hypothetical protein C8R44DRAFT_807737, partial [Mycena epipterygia]
MATGGDTEREGSGSRQGGKEGRAERSGKRDVAMRRARGEGRTQWGRRSCRRRRSTVKEGKRVVRWKWVDRKERAAGSHSYSSRTISRPSHSPNPYFHPRTRTRRA